MSAFLDAIMPQLTELIVACIGVIGATVLLAIRQYLAVRIGDQAAKQAVEILHKALDTGVRAALAKNPQGDTKAIVDSAIKHVTLSVPDTITMLDPPVEVLRNIALSKLQAIGGK